MFGQPWRRDTRVSNQERGYALCGNQEWEHSTYGNVHEANTKDVMEQQQGRDPKGLHQHAKASNLHMRKPTVPKAPRSTMHNSTQPRSTATPDTHRPPVEPELHHTRRHVRWPPRRPRSASPNPQAPLTAQQQASATSKLVTPSNPNLTPVQKPRAQFVHRANSNDFDIHNDHDIDSQGAEAPQTADIIPADAEHWRNRVLKAEADREMAYTQIELLDAKYQLELKEKELIRTGHFEPSQHALPHIGRTSQHFQEGHIVEKRVLEAEITRLTAQSNRFRANIIDLSHQIYRLERANELTSHGDLKRKFVKARKERDKARDALANLLHGNGTKLDGWTTQEEQAAAVNEDGELVGNMHDNIKKRQRSAPVRYGRNN